ncbi:hypothetical protein ACLOJK_003357 [Asimina triloba]
MIERNVVVWTLMITRLTQCGSAKDAIDLFIEMEVSGFIPDHGNPKEAWISLGGVVLCLTGTEAMLPISPSFHSDAADAFYKATPNSVYWPMFVIAVLASIIASQAMISASFSIVQQSMALVCFPRVRVVHTSNKKEGQIYFPEINLLLCLACIFFIAFFKESANMGNAYGIAVVGVMLVTSCMLILIMLMIWQINLLLIALFTIIFVTPELAYFASMMYKFKQGGYITLAFAAVLSFIMYVWHYVQAKRLTLGVPPLFNHFLTNLPAIHSVLVFVSVKYLPVNKVPPEERFLFQRVGAKHLRMYRSIARYGYRDCRVGHEEFEKLMMEHLVTFIRMENEAASMEDSEEAEKEVQFLKWSRNAGGIVYLVGHSELKLHSCKTEIQKGMPTDSGVFFRIMKESAAWNSSEKVSLKALPSMMILLGRGRTRDGANTGLPQLVYVSREKHPSYNHNRKAGAMNALVRVSALGNPSETSSQKTRGAILLVLTYVAAKAWTMWEMITAHLLPNEENINRGDDDAFALAFARIENHYFVNNGFLSSDSFLLDNIEKIRHIKTVIVQVVPDAGHSANEPGIAAELVSANEMHKDILKAKG